MALPIRELTLYKHGVCVVERGGGVSGDQVVLTFHRDQMNDVLKSLIAFDRGGGQVHNIAYDAPEEREKKLERGAINLSENASVVDLVRDLRGREVRVELTGEGQSLTGVMVGLDAHETFPFAQGRLSLRTDEGVHVVRLREVETITLLDSQARADLDFFLRLSTAEPEQRTVTLRLSEGSHDLTVRYLVPSPTWRVSYRFVGESEEGGARQALVQGWGIFDNPFDEPLEQVRVSLVSGMPISFVYDLYTPFTPERPAVKEEARVAAAPVMMERAMQAKAFAAAPPAAAPAAFRSAPREALADEAAYAAPTRDMLAAGTAVAAEGSAQGDLFEYRIAHPVTVQRGEAAMVPILGTGLPYRKEHVYNGRKMPKHPTVVLRFDNESELTLERGPITVLENGNYLGEAIFPFTRPGAEVLLAIAVDLGVSVREERKSTREVFRVTVEKGFLVQHHYTTVTTSYEVSNTNKEPVTLLIEHPRNSGFTPLEMPDPEETTEQHYRWKVEVPAGPEGHATFAVRERRLDRSQEQLATVAPATLMNYLRQRWLDQALENELRQLLSLQADKQRLYDRLAAIENERGQLMAGQEQARKNMSGLKDSGPEGELRARYVRQLNESEDALAALEQERVRLKEDEGRLEEQIQQQIAALG